MLATQTKTASVRKYTPADYTLLTTWWKSYEEWDAVPEALLSNDGYIVEVDGTPVCAGFLFVASNSNCAWAEWIVADANADKPTRSLGLETLYNTFSEQTLANGQQFLLTCTKSEGLIKRLEGLGYVRGDVDMSMMIRRVK